MTVNDLKIIKNSGYTRTYDVDDRNTSGLSVTIKPGEAVKIGGAGSNFLTLLVSGEPVATSGLYREMVGIVRKESTEVAATDGTCEVTLIYPMSTVIRGKAHTVGNISTAAELLALRYDWVLFDIVTGGGAQTINENEGDDPDINGLCIIDGDIVAGTLDVIVSARVTAAAPTTA